MKIKNLALPSIVIIITLLFYYPIFQSGFSQDDFIHMYSSTAKNLPEFLNFFNPFHQYPDIFFYRPLTTLVYFFFNISLFGFNPTPFHIEAIILHLINSYLFYLIVLNIWKEKKIAILSTLFYAVSSIHFLSFFYISAFQQIGQKFFIFSSILFFLKFIEKKKQIYLIFSLLLYIGALLSKETAVVLPLLLIPLLLLKDKINKKTLLGNLNTLTPFIFITLIYFLIRQSGFQSIFNEGSYQTSFSISNIFQNLKWYLLWNFGLPEVISTYPSLGLSSINQFIKDNSFGLTIIVSFSVLISSLIPTLLFINKKALKLFLLATFCFLLSLGPVLLLSEHKYPHYLDLSYLFSLPLMFYFLIKTKKLQTILLPLTILSFMVLQFATLRLSEQIHWTTHRAIIADFYIQQIDQDLKTKTKPLVIIFQGEEEKLKEVSVALGRNYGLKSIFKEKVTEVIYTPDSSNIKGEKLIYQISKY